MGDSEIESFPKATSQTILRRILRDAYLVQGATRWSFAIVMEMVFVAMMELESFNHTGTVGYICICLMLNIISLIKRR